MKIKTPEYAPIFNSAICPICREKTYKPVMHDGRLVCVDCAGADYYILDGRGIQQEKQRRLKF